MSSAVIERRSDAAEARRAHVRRLAACLAGGVVLALMIGNQEGTQQDFYFAIRKALFGPRILIFLAVGVLLYLAITFRPRIAAYATRPGLRPLGAGILTVIVAHTLLKWSDSLQVGTGKFGELAKAARQTQGLDPLARLYFGSAVSFMAWLMLIVIGGLAFVAVVTRRSVLGYVAGALGLLAGVWAIYTQHMIRSFLGTPDHSTGGAVAMLGWFVIAIAAFVAARSSAAEADRADFTDRVLAWRPGMPLVVLGAIVGLVAVFQATWFSPNHLNAHLSDLARLFTGEGVNAFAFAFLQWLGYLWFAVALVVAVAASYLRHQLLGWAAAAVGAFGALATLLTAHAYSGAAAAQHFDNARGAWDNLGTGPWMAAAAFTLFAGAGWLVVRAIDDEKRAAAGPRSAIDSDTIGSSLTRPSQLGATTMLLMITVALFYPPTASQFWQTVLVSEIGIYVLLAIGLNVVVGWAGLLDLGFIAFYAIGSYTTAYVTGRLPAQPPHWLHLLPLQAIPFAVAACLVAGVCLGAPTLRLRGDYLAIVTLGFGEIIRVVANNATPITNGPRGAFNIPAPRIHIGPLKIQWGDSALGYWYLLLVMTVIVILLFNRLEHSRLGRAWAAIREDEVAAQATGIDTMRVKLLAFAIGASTSGLAGVFFASQVGSFTPENFVLNNSILVVAYVVFGGMGSLAGAMAGAAVLTWLPEFLKDQVPAEDRQMWIGALIMLMMIFRPAGLIPARRRRAELSGLDQPASAESTAVPAAEGM